MEHLFSFCLVWKSVAEYIKEHFNLFVCLSGASIEFILKDWHNKIPRSSPLFLLLYNMMWIFWKARNLAVFEGKKRNIYGIIQQILSIVQAPFPGTATKNIRRRLIGNPPDKSFPCGFIDGASQNMIVGAGFCIFLNDSHFLEFSMGVGHGTNTKAELLSLWALLHTSHMMGIPLAQVFGDSQVIINWAKGSTALSPPELVHWCWETKKLASSFQDLSFIHIYREHNKTADRLSKKALSLSQGKGCLMEFIENLLVTQDYFQLY